MVDEPQPALKVAYITAGAAGMYCGSCMHDNTLARALALLNVDIQLIPTYTPIRTDEQDVSVDRVFFGGINVYLQQKIPFFRFVPSLLDRFLDRPRILRWATSRGIEISPKELGALTVSMLRGEHGYQRKEVRKLCNWLAESARPDLINLSNMLIAGCVPAIKQRLRVPVLATLQGDDIFLDELPEPFKSRAFEELRRLVQHIDAFIVFSRYYADFMSSYLDIPASKFRVVPLGLDTADFIDFDRDKDCDKGRDKDDAAAAKNDKINDNSSTSGGAGQRPRAVGYLARVAPEKGLHLLADAFIELKQQQDMDDVRLEIAGWLGDHNQQYAEDIYGRLGRANLKYAFRYHGSVDRRSKLSFLRQIDVLSVPTTYHEPKGLFVLEALAAGIPVVQPNHGAFPELIAATGGGHLVTPADTDQLAAVLAQLLRSPEEARALGSKGRDSVRTKFDAATMAQSTLDVYREFVKG